MYWYRMGQANCLSIRTLRVILWIDGRNAQDSQQPPIQPGIPNAYSR